MGIRQTIDGEAGSARIFLEDEDLSRGGGGGKWFGAPAVAVPVSRGNLLVIKGTSNHEHLVQCLLENLNGRDVRQLMELREPEGHTTHLIAILESRNLRPFEA